MSGKLLFALPTIVVSLILTFAPVFGQDAGNMEGTADVDRIEARATEDDGPDLGWLGLIGLVGLGGLMRRDRDDRRHADRNVNR